MGLADVATAASHRGREIGAMMLTDAISVAQDAIADFCILFGGRSLYAGYDVVTAHNPLRFVVLDGERRTSSKPIQMLA
jgi:predicted N-acetyltransferase YhbS